MRQRKSATAHRAMGKPQAGEAMIKAVVKSWKDVEQMLDLGTPISTWRKRTLREIKVDGDEKTVTFIYSDNVITATADEVEKAEDIFSDRDIESEIL